MEMDLEPAGRLVERFVSETRWHARPIVERDSLKAVLSPTGALLWVDQQAEKTGAACTFEAPCTEIGAALRRARAGDAVVVRAGTYREALLLKTGGEPDRPLTLAAYPGEAVVVSGSDPLTDGWRADGTNWERSWRVSLPMHRSKQRPQDAFRPELLFVDGLPLRAVFASEKLNAGGTFWVEGEPESPRRIVANFKGQRRPDSLAIEAGIRPMLLTGADSTVRHVRIIGMAFMQAPNSGKDGCVQAVGDHWEVEENLVAWCNGLGIMVGGHDQTFRGNWAMYNGQMGWSSRTHHSLLEDNRSVGNNWKGYDARWEAGGGKFVETSYTTIRRHYAAYNQGPGIWLDIDNTNNIVEGSLVVGNLKAGIMIEYRSTHNVVRNNVVYGTRLLDGTGSGIQIQATSDNRIEMNTVYSNEGDGIRYKHGDIRAVSGGTVFSRNLVLNNGLGPTRAQEIRVEGTPPPDKPDTYDDNVYGRRGNEDAVFFIAEMPSNDLDTWQRFSQTTNDRIQAHPRRALVDVRSADGWRASEEMALSAYGVQLDRVGPR
ncbi:MAG: right-handed parallel beta-helix repeat-containing protein [Rhodothermales bacterium]